MYNYANKLSLTPENLDSSVSIEYKNAPDEPSAAALLKMAEADEGKHYTLSLWLLFWNWRN